MKKVPGSCKFPRAGKSFQTPVIKKKVGKNKKSSILETSKVTAMIKLLLFLLFLCAALQGTAATTKLVSDTTNPNRDRDSIARANEFAAHFSDTATLGHFQMWLYKHLVAEQYASFSQLLNSYYSAYINERYNEFIKIEGASGVVKPKQSPSTGKKN